MPDKELFFPGRSDREIMIDGMITANSYLVFPVLIVAFLCFLFEPTAANQKHWPAQATDFELSERLDSDAAIEYLEHLINQNRKVYNIEVIFGPGAQNPTKLPNPEMWIYDDPQGSDANAIKAGCMKLVTDAVNTFGKSNVHFEICHDKTSSHIRGRGKEKRGGTGKHAQKPEFRL